MAPELKGALIGMALGLGGLALAWRLGVRPALLAQIGPQVQRELGRLPPDLGPLVQAVSVPAVAGAIGEAVRIVLERELP